jgi:hypothetical protein
LSIGSNLVLLAGLVIGLVYGAIGLLSGFCLMSSLRGWWAEGDSRLVRSYALAMGIVSRVVENGKHLLHRYFGVARVRFNNIFRRDLSQLGTGSQDDLLVGHRFTSHSHRKQPRSGSFCLGGLWFEISVHSNPCVPEKVPASHLRRVTFKAATELFPNFLFFWPGQ